MITKQSDLTKEVLSLLPLFYVGWSDSVLSPSEMKLIHQKIKEYDFLSVEEKSYLIKYTDPKSPPEQAVFKFWGDQIRKAAKDFPIEKKASLLSLGAEISKSINGVDKVDNINAMTDLQEALGLDDRASAMILASKIFPDSLEGISVCGTCTVDPNKLQALLDGAHREVKDRVRTILSDPFFDNEHIPDKDVYRLKILQQIKALAKQGLSAYSFPKKYGGFEQKGAHIAVFEMLGYADLSLSIKFGVQFGLFGGAVYQLGTEKHHAKYVEPLHKAELLGCFAMTETGHGSDVKSLKTTATYNHSKKSITVHSPSFEAGKEYIGNAIHSEMAAVFAQLIVDGESHGVHCVLVPIRDKAGGLCKGVKVEDCGYKLGLNGVDNGRIWFDQVEVPVDNLLNRFGDIDAEGKYTSPIINPSRRFFTMLGALVVGRICVGLLGVNAAKKALHIAISYAQNRRQFASKDGEQDFIIMNYPTHQKRLIPQLAKTYGYYFALSDLAEKYVHAEDPAEIRQVETLAAGLKAKATWMATDTIQTCRESCGGKGYLDENQFARLKADSDIFTTFEGDNTVLMQLVAKGALTEFKQSFHDDGYRAIVRYLYTKVKHEILEINPVFKRSTDSAHLLDSSFHFHAIKYRKKKTLIALSDRMRKYLGRGMDPFQAFLKVQNHMIDLADAFIDLTVLESFYEKVEQLDDMDAQKGIRTLCQLYALETIQENKGWYLENDYMDGIKTKAIRRMISKLYQQILPNLEAYTKAFGIPKELVKAPIAYQEFS